MKEVILMALPVNVNLADKFSPKLDQAFKLSSYTDPYVNKDYDFDGVNSIKVYTLDTAPMVDYDVSNNANRYGGFSEITDSVETYTLKNDKAFQKTLDRMNRDDSAQAKKAAQWLALQMNRRIVPMVDKDRFATASAAATTAAQSVTYTPAAVLDQLRTANAALDDMSVPLAGRAYFTTSTGINDLKKELTPILNNSSDAIVRSRGLAGTIDGLPVISVPSALLPTDVKGIMWHKDALLAARKLSETKILDGAWVVDGEIIQGRFRFDSWALKGHDDVTDTDVKLKTFWQFTA